MLVVLHSTNRIHKTYELFFQLVLVLDLLHHHVCLREFGLQQLFFQVSVFEHLLQVLEDSQVNLGVVVFFYTESCFHFFGCIKLKRYGNLGEMCK